MQNDDIINPVGKAGEQGELDCGQINDHVVCGRGAEAAEKSVEQAKENPTADVKGDGFHFALVQSRGEHHGKSVQKEGKTPKHQSQENFFARCAK